MSTMTRFAKLRKPSRNDARPVRPFAEGLDIDLETEAPGVKLLDTCGDFDFIEDADWRSRPYGPQFFRYQVRQISTGRTLAGFDGLVRAQCAFSDLTKPLAPVKAKAPVRQTGRYYFDFVPSDADRSWAAATARDFDNLPAPISGGSGEPDWDRLADEAEAQDRLDRGISAGMIPSRAAALLIGLSLVGHPA